MYNLLFLRSTQSSFICQAIFFGRHPCWDRFAWRKLAVSQALSCFSEELRGFFRLDLGPNGNDLGHAIPDICTSRIVESRSLFLYFKKNSKNFINSVTPSENCWRNNAIYFFSAKSIIWKIFNIHLWDSILFTFWQLLVTSQKTNSKSKIFMWACQPPPYYFFY